MPEPAGDIGLSDIDRAPFQLPTNNALPELLPHDKLLERFTAVSEEKVRLEEELSRLKVRVKTGEILDSLITPYARRAYNFMVGYCVFAGITLMFEGVHYHGFDLPSSVLELLVGSTAVTVIGLVGMVLTGIFVGARSGGRSA